MSSNRFLLEAGELQRFIAKPETFVAEQRFADIRVIETRIDADWPVRLSCSLDALHDGVMVTADVAARWIAPCRLCGTEVAEQTSWQVSEYFVPSVDESPSPDETPTQDESENYPLGDDFLDMAPMIRDQLLLQLPLAPVCSENCKGLCNKCGVDLNKDSCDCESEITDPRWDALSQITFEE